LSQQPPARSAVDPRAPAELFVAVPATGNNVRHVRHRLRAWLDRLSWPEPARDDVVLAVNEALANVVDHAYAPSDPTGTAQLHCWQVIEDGARYLVAVIIDWGSWKATPRDTAYRGRGLAMMSACMNHMLVQPSRRGTTVILTSDSLPPVPEQPPPPRRAR